MSKQIELMRSLTAMQAALWDVVDNPEAEGARRMLAVMHMTVTRLTNEVVGQLRGANDASRS